MIYMSFVLYNDDGFEIKNISEKDFLEINDIQEIQQKINILIKKINKKNGLNIKVIDDLTNFTIKNLNCNYTINLEDSVNITQNNIESSVKKFYNSAYLFKIDDYSNRVCGLRESITMKYKNINNFNSESNILKYFKILRENSPSLDIEKFKRDIWIQKHG